MKLLLLAHGSQAGAFAWLHSTGRSRSFDAGVSLL
jgi:hypothetical protein